MPYDATKMVDWQIAEAAEANMPTPMSGRRGWAWKRMRSFLTEESPSSIS